MTVNAIKFPVLRFSQNLVGVKRTEDDLTTCTKVALKKGFFNEMLVVEESGKAYKVNGARKLHGVGPFWGYNIFLNQMIRVELLFQGNPFQITVDEVKKKVLLSFKKRHGWSTRGDFEELRESVENAKTILEIIQLLSVK
jgi:hypothetical protein